MKLLKNLLNDGLVEVTFTKQDGTERVMTCTNNSRVVNELVGPPKVDGVSKPGSDTLFRVVDMNLGEWRSFNFDQVITFKAV